MKVLRKDWLHHNGGALYSVDIQPDGKRLATGGLGSDQTGLAIIWSFTAVKLPNSPKKSDDEPGKTGQTGLLCRLSNHATCVNCVRWSPSGQLLASASDDASVMVWHYVGPAPGVGLPAFGASKSDSSAPNVEQWKCGHQLRAHTQDVLHVAWSHSGAYLASCSVDNTIIVWDAIELPRQVAVLKGHQGLVKGLAWDPIGKYLVSQCSDKTLKVWATTNWTCIKTIREPFKESGNTTYVIRPDWSPDGACVVAAHALNNSGPTAQVIGRGSDWPASTDFVGHRKAVTCVRFNPVIFKKEKKPGSGKWANATYCACGSKDRGLSFWKSGWPRPLCTLGSVFASTVMDLAWSSDGRYSLACSIDGTVVMIDFGEQQLGKPLSSQDKYNYLVKNYGPMASLRSVLATKDQNAAAIVNGAGIREDDMVTLPDGPDILNAHKQFEEERRKQKEDRDAAILAASAKAQSQTQIVPVGGTDPAPVSAPFPSLNPQSCADKNSSSFTETSTQPATVTNGLSSQTPPTEVDDGHSQSSVKSSGGSTLPLAPQSESRTKEGKRRITPMFLGNAMVAAGGQSVVMSSPLSGAGSQHGTPVQVGATTVGAIAPTTQIIAVPPSSNSAGSCDGVLGGHPVVSETGRPLGAGGAKRKLNDDQPVGEVEDGILEMIPSTSTANVLDPSLRITLPKRQQTLRVQISRQRSSVYLDVQNDQPIVGDRKLRIHRLRCVSQAAEVLWETLVEDAALCLAASSHIVAVGCADRTLSIFSADSGAVEWPGLVLSGQPCHLAVRGWCVLVITDRGLISVWNVEEDKNILSDQCLHPLLIGGESPLQFSSASVTSSGCPIVTVSSGSTYIFDFKKKSWIAIAKPDAVLYKLSTVQPYSFEDSILSPFTKKFKLTATQVKRPSAPDIQRLATLKWLESQLQVALAVQSPKEYQRVLCDYVQALVNSGCEKRIKELCRKLLGPISGFGGQQSESILGLKKRDLLKSILLVLSKSQTFQSLYTEYSELLEEQDMEMNDFTIS